MTLFQLCAVLMGIVAVVGWLNGRTWRIPHGMAMLVAGVASVALLAGARAAWPSWTAAAQVTEVVKRIDFTSAVLDYMLCFLLFAAAINLDLEEMRRRWASVTALASLGVVGSLLVVGVGLWAIARWFGLDLSLPWALVFGALISPTDPVVVTSTLREGKVSALMRALLQGESLFNDGMGIIAYTALVQLADPHSTNPSWLVLLQVPIEALGGLGFGLLAGYGAMRAIAAIDEAAVEVTLSVALAMGVYAAAGAMHLSAPIAVVGAGLPFSSASVKKAMNDATEAHLRVFWTLSDEILNAVLFLLLGMEMLVVPFQFEHIGVLLAGIPLVFLARLVVLPWGLYHQRRQREPGAALILCWGGLHGALSLALALALPESPERTLILDLTYTVVTFSILAQGLSFGWLVRRMGRVSTTG